MSIGYYCNREVIMADVDTSALEAARLMREHHVGSLVIVERKGEDVRPIGIVTDRDLVLEIMAPNLDPDTILVSDFMSENLHVAREDENLSDVVHAMRTHSIRRIPVVDGQGRLQGIFSMDDMIALVAEEMDDIARLVVRERDRESQVRRL